MNLLMKGTGPTRRKARAISMLPTMDTIVGYLMRSQICNGRLKTNFNCRELITHRMSEKGRNKVKFAPKVAAGVKSIDLLA